MFYHLMPKLTYHLTAFRRPSGETWPPSRDARRQTRHLRFAQVIQLGAVIVLGLSVVVAVVLVSFTLGVMLSIPLFAAALWWMVRSFWCRWFGARDIVNDHRTRGDR